MRIAQWAVPRVAALLLMSSGAPLWAQFTIQGPGVDPADFRITTFATGLNFPVGMAELEDGSLLVAVSNGNSFFSSNSGSILRLVDTDGDGVVDQQTAVVGNVPGGGLTTVRVAGDLVFTTGQGRNKPISIYRLGPTSTDPLTSLGSISVNYPNGGWLHPHSALTARETPGQPGSYELYFQLGSRENFAVTTSTASITSNIGVSGTIAGDAIHRVTITDDGTSIASSDLTQIATGLRNSAGFAFHPITGDLYLEDNGIDGLVDVNEPHSADELNVLPAAEIGGDIESFGFPDTYVEYRTGAEIGGTGIEPLVAFQPINGEEGEGPNDIAFAPPRFPASLRNGVFVGMHGKFFLGGLENEENPLVFANLNDNSYFHFIRNNEASIGHLDGLLSTRDSLFLADMSPGGGFGSSDAFSGNIYQIRSLAISGDFNADGSYDCIDIDALVGEIATGADNPAFDLTGDGSVDLEDRDAWLAEAGAINNPSGNPYLIGDANLDRSVDVSDFNLWNANKFNSVAQWCAGDFTADGNVDVSDFNAWNANKFDTADAVPQPVPEPAGTLFLLAAAVGFVCRRGVVSRSLETLGSLREPDAVNTCSRQDKQG